MPYFDDIFAGEVLPKLVKGPITRQHLVEWCAAENDYYHLHYDERVAASMKLPGTPIQGTYQYALLGQLVNRWLAGTGSLNRIECAYRGLILEGETLSCGGQVRSCVRDGHIGRAEIELWVENTSGERATTGTALVALPVLADDSPDLGKSGRTA